MKRPLVVCAALLGVLLYGAPGELGTSVVRPEGLSGAWRAEPLGWVRVTQYTHVETRTRLTSSGYILKDSDEGLVCAISRDWWKKRVKVGDLVWVTGFAQPCVALDTMAPANRRGLAQTRWVDIYVTSRSRGLDFGIRKSSAYIIRPMRGDYMRYRTPKAARRFRKSLAA
ncbi:MAG: hypothetical protein NTX64_17855 [Elusimicrobia bacterium]|nr:hypothetical protein [Elusimicrobiota bacterium]